MGPNTPEEQLVKYLTDVHSIEQQALAQLKAAPRLAGDPGIAEPFAVHLTETEGHEQTVARLLEHHDARPSKLKDIVGTLTGAGFGAFAAAQPDTPGKLVAHAFSYEHMEEAAYHLLGKLAEQVADTEVASAAREIERQERVMADRLAGCFDLAVDVALRDVQAEDMNEQLTTYLTDAHAIEQQSLQLLERGRDLAGVPALATIYEQHRDETEEHQRLVEAELDGHGVALAKIKDAAMGLGAINWGLFFQAQPDTPAKLAAFAYAFEHLEIAAYELVLRVAQRAADDEVQRLAGHVLGEERAAAGKIWDRLGEALSASLEEQGVARAG